MHLEVDGDKGSKSYTVSRWIAWLMRGRRIHYLEWAISDKHKAGPKVNIVAEGYYRKESNQSISEVSACVI